MTPDKEQVVEPLTADHAHPWLCFEADCGIDAPRIPADAARTASVAGLDRERLAAAISDAYDNPEYEEGWFDKGDIPRPAVMSEQIAASYDRLGSAPSIEQEPGEWSQRAALMAADRALAVPHREDDKPCGCDECMADGAEDEGGGDWYRVPTPNRIVIRALDSGDDRLAPLVKAFDDHAAALRDDREGPQ